MTSSTRLGAVPGPLHPRTVNGFGTTGTIDRVYRPLGLGFIKPDNAAPKVLFTTASVKNGMDSVAEGVRVRFRVFPESIEGLTVASDVWVVEQKLP